MQALIAVFAVLAGILLGFWIRTVSAKRELALLDQRNRESFEALAALPKAAGAGPSRVRRPRRLRVPRRRTRDRPSHS